MFVQDVSECIIHLEELGRTILILLIDIIKIAIDEDLAYLYEQKVQYF